MSNADERLERGQDVTDEVAGADPGAVDDPSSPDLTAAGLGVTDEPNPGEADRSGISADTAPDEAPAVYSAGDVDLEYPDGEVQTTTERTIDGAASAAGRHVAAAARAGWDDAELKADPPSDYDLMAPPEGGPADAG